MAGHMRAAIELARQAHAQSGRRAVAAIIVHPHSQPGEEVQVRAETRQTLTRRPAQPTPTPTSRHTGSAAPPGTRAAAVTDEGALWPPQVLAACPDCTVGGGEGGGEGAPAHPLHHALMRCIEEVARRRRLEQRPPARHAAAAAAAAEAEAAGSATAAVAGSKRAAPTSGGGGASDGGGGGEGGGGAAAQADAKAYLCSGCDAYVTLEPCAMCAMALAHARIRRLVYAVPCASEGALGSRYRVHTERSINHHYQVFRGLLCDEARAALDVDESRAA